MLLYAVFVDVAADRFFSSDVRPRGVLGGCLPRVGAGSAIPFAPVPAAEPVGALAGTVVPVDCV